MSNHSETRLRWAFVAIASLYFLNDLSNLYIKDWRLWLLVDYGIVKLGTLLAFAFMLKRQWITLPELGFPRQPPASFVLTFVGVTLFGVVAGMNLGPYLLRVFGDSSVGEMPAIPSRFWNQLDLTVGLFLVGLTEELVFRGLILRLLSRLTSSPPAIIIASSVIFGLIHWSGGLHAIVTTAVIGALFTACYLRTRSLPALILAHFAIDFIVYGTTTFRSHFQFYR